MAAWSRDGDRVASVEAWAVADTLDNLLPDHNSELLAASTAASEEASVVVAAAVFEEASAVTIVVDMEEIAEDSVATVVDLEEVAVVLDSKIVAATVVKEVASIKGLLRRMRPVAQADVVGASVALIIDETATEVAKAAEVGMDAIVVSPAVIASLFKARIEVTTIVTGIETETETETVIGDVTTTMEEDREKDTTRTTTTTQDNVVGIDRFDASRALYYCKLEVSSLVFSKTTALFRHSAHRFGKQGIATLLQAPHTVLRVFWSTARLLSLDEPGVLKS